VYIPNSAQLIQWIQACFNSLSTDYLLFTNHLKNESLCIFDPMAKQQVTAEYLFKEKEFGRTDSRIYPRYFLTQTFCREKGKDLWHFWQTQKRQDNFLLHSLSLTLSLSLSLSVSFSCTHSHSLSLTLTLSFSIFLSYTHSHSLTYANSLSLSLTL